MILFGIQSQNVLAITANDVDSVFKSAEASDWYISRTYSSDFSKDPFGDAMTNIEEMSNQLKKSWAKYVQEALSEKGCSLSSEKISAILYNFVPEFRAEIARTLKMGNSYDSKLYVFNEEVIFDYCKEYFLCEMNWSEELAPQEITADSSEDIMTNCQEFFQNNYREWAANEKRIQNTKITQLWSDRYRNETTEDSPYDIMVDLWILWKLNYQGAEEPIKPVFFDIEAFSNSRESLSQGMSSSSSSTTTTTTSTASNSHGSAATLWSSSSATIWNWTTRSASMSASSVWSTNLLWTSSTTSLWWNIRAASVSASSVWWNSTSTSLGTLNTKSESSSLSANAWWTTLWWNSDSSSLTRAATNNVWSDWWNWSVNSSSSNPRPLPLDVKWWYDDLVEWLNSSSITNDQFYCNTCGSSDNNSEPEWQWWSNGSATNPESSDNGWWRSFSELSEQEYQELVDYMTNAVDKYDTLPADKEQEMNQVAWDTSSYLSDQDASQFDATAKKIKNCWWSCEWMRIDLKASCMLKCACWHIESPIFDPEKFPWLWPIFVIRFCTVPSTDTKFSKWWKRIHSIEEWFKEIYGAVDKLSREWRLWVWTQQYNFLDSTTKKIKIADNFAFTIDIEFVDLADKMPEQTEHYKKKKLEDDNKVWQTMNYVKNPLDSSDSKNRYMAVWNRTENVRDITAATNPSQNREINADLDQIPEPMVNPSDDSDAYRYNLFASHFGRFMDQQWTLWTNITNNAIEMNSYSKMLYSRKDRSKYDPRFNVSD